MDIEKICRCCLALSGPLLSIYDGESQGSGRVVNMLREITELKPQQNDNMPEKVCLSCISEINRCYVFKIKCESSNKTLRQLLPDAVKEHLESPQKVLRIDVGVQTQSVKEEKSLRSIHVQTASRTEVQSLGTEDRETQTHLEFSASRHLLVDETAVGSVIKRKHSINSPTKIENFEKEKKIRFEYDLPHVSNEVDIEDPQQETFILVETLNNDSVSSNEQLFMHSTSTGESEQQQKPHLVKSESPPPEHFEYYDTIEDEAIEDGVPTQAHLNEYVEHEEIDHEENGQSKNIPSQEDKEHIVHTRSASSLTPRSNPRREQFKCSLCIMTFFSRNVLRRHLAKRHSITDSHIKIDEVRPQPVRLPVIEKVYSTEGNVSNDQVELTMENVPKPHLLPRGPFSPKVDDQLFTKFKYYCEHCHAGFAQRKTLAYHVKQNICKTNNFKCSQCERIFISQENLEAHESTHNSQHTCLECNKVCGSVVELSEHMIEAHNRNARNQCHVCKKVFTMKASLMDHLRIHSGEKPFLCTVCGKKFRQNSNLRQHLMRHTNEKNFKCDMCPNAYVTKAELFSHQRTHTGDHPFKCDICQTSFTSSSSLLKHKRKHTGERPYACEFCPMRFSALNVLKNHRRTHTGEKPFKCDYCDKRFTQKGDCLVHQRTHEYGEVKCFCGSKFSKISNLRQHIKLKHPNMTDEKRREMNDALNKPQENGSELQITVMEDEDEDIEGDMLNATEHYVTISGIDNSYVKSQQQPRSNDEEEFTTEIILEDIS